MEDVRKLTLFQSHSWRRACRPYALDLPVTVVIQDQAYRQPGRAYTNRTG